MTTPTKPAITWHHATVTRERREQLLKHKSTLLWFTGLSGAGKSTLAHAVEESLYQKGYHTFVLDGDNVRHGLCKDLGFKPEDREENIRRIGEMSRLFVEAGVIALSAFISPFEEDRARVRELLGVDFIEIYCQCSLEVCEARDVKGLYKKARAGEIKNFTGISAPFENPIHPTIEIKTIEESPQQAVAKILEVLKSKL